MRAATIAGLVLAGLAGASVPQGWPRCGGTGVQTMLLLANSTETRWGSALHWAARLRGTCFTHVAAADVGCGAEAWAPLAGHLRAHPRTLVLVRGASTDPSFRLPLLDNVHAMADGSRAVLPVGSPPAGTAFGALVLLVTPGSDGQEAALAAGCDAARRGAARRAARDLWQTSPSVRDPSTGAHVFTPLSFAARFQRTVCDGIGEAGGRSYEAAGDAGAGAAGACAEVVATSTARLPGGGGGGGGGFAGPWLWTAVLVGMGVMGLAGMYGGAAGASGAAAGAAGAVARAAEAAAAMGAMPAPATTRARGGRRKRGKR